MIYNPTIKSEIDTSDATATADDIVKDKTAYIAGGKVSGSLVPFWETRCIATLTAGSAKGGGPSTVIQYTLNKDLAIASGDFSAETGMYAFSGDFVGKAISNETIELRNNQTSGNGIAQGDIIYVYGK